MPDGVVTKQAWDAFLSSEVTPRFPQGFTVISAAGQWQGESGEIVREPSYLLSVVHPGDSESESAIKAMVATYKERFQQEAVLRVKRPACTSL